MMQNPASPLDDHWSAQRLLVYYRTIDALFFCRGHDLKAPVRNTDLDQFQSPTFPKLNVYKLGNVESLVHKTLSSWPLVQAMSTERQEGENVALHLWNSIQRTVSSKQIFRIIHNFQLAAFHLHFILDGQLDLPSGKVELLKYLNLPAYFEGEVFRPSDLRPPLLLSLFISPLMLLVPITLEKKGPAIKDLIMCWRKMGQLEKPPGITSAEREVWSAVLDIAQGAPSLPRIKRCLDDLSNIEFEHAPGWILDGDQQLPRLVYAANPYSVIPEPGPTPMIEGAGGLSNLSVGLRLTQSLSTSAAAEAMTINTGSGAHPVPPQGPTLPEVLTKETVATTSYVRGNKGRSDVVADANDSGGTAEMDLDSGSEKEQDTAQKARRTRRGTRGAEETAVQAAAQEKTGEEEEEEDRAADNVPDADGGGPDAEGAEEEQEGGLPVRQERGRRWGLGRITVQGFRREKRAKEVEPNKGLRKVGRSRNVEKESIIDVERRVEPGRRTVEKLAKDRRVQEIEKRKRRDDRSTRSVERKKKKITAASPGIAKVGPVLAEPQLVDLTLEEETEATDAGIPRLVVEPMQMVTTKLTLDIPGSESIRIKVHHENQTEFLQNILANARATEERAQRGEYQTSVKRFDSTCQDWQAYRTHSIHIVGAGDSTSSLERFEEEVGKIRWGDLSQKFQVHDLSIELPLDDSESSQHREGTLGDILDAAKGEHPKALNVLDIPGTRDSFDFPQLSSDRVAWDLAPKTSVKGEEYPVAALRWWLVSTGWTSHTIHQDCDGFGTIIKVLTGTKVWMIVSPRAEAEYPASIYRLMRGFDLEGVNENFFDVEIVILKAGDTLPRTLHAVLTPEPTVVIGGHLYSTMTIRETVWGIYDDFVLGKYLTNTEHRSASLAVLGRILSLWYTSLVEGASKSHKEVTRWHIPDVTNPEEFKDFLAFTTLFELYGVLCGWFYESGDYSLGTLESRKVLIQLRKRARNLRRWAFSNYAVYQVEDGEDPCLCNSLDVESRFLASQAMALLQYKSLAMGSKYMRGQVDVSIDQLRTALMRTLKGSLAGDLFDAEDGTADSFEIPVRYVLRPRDKPLEKSTATGGMTAEDWDYIRGKPVDT
ncbi:hypothetical protein C0991_009718 [Blastosporella zonata]|nr:hypothetical protein C0991_009718 [Blastosporella zonata]